MAGSQLRLLAHASGIKLAAKPRRISNVRFNFHSTVPSHHDHLARLQGSGSIQYVLQQGTTGQPMQDLGQAALHAGTFARGHNDHVHGPLPCAIA